MQPATLEITYDQFMDLPDTRKPYALEYMRLALEVSRHNLEVAYFNKSPSDCLPPVGDYPAPVPD